MMKSWRHLPIALALCLSIAAPALAQSPTGGDKPKSPTDEEPKQKRTMPNPSPKVAKRLIAAQAALTENKTETAQRELDELAKQKGLKPHEQAMIYQFYGYLENQLDRPKKAIYYFKKAIDLDVLDYAQQYSLEWNVAQLEMSEENYVGALEIMREWFKKTRRKGSPVTPNGNNYYVLAVCYMNLPVPSPQRALRPAQLAVEASDEPQENWLRLLGSIYYQLGDYAKMAEVLETLIERYAKGEYFKQLSGAYAEGGMDKKAIAVMQLAYQLGVLTTDRDLIQLARMYLYHEIPLPAAQVLEKGISEGVIKPDIVVNQLLSDAYLAARETEKSFAPLEQAAQLSPNGDLYLRLGQAYVGKQKWQEADEALGKALNKGNLKDPGNAHLLRGIARMNLRSWSGAVASFNAAGQFGKLEEAADQYKRYLNQRRKQVEALGNS